MSTAATEAISVPVGKFPATARARGKIAPVRFAHIVLKTKRYRKMVDWYETVLEAEPVFEQEGLCFMTYDEEHHRIGIARIPMLFTAPKFFTGADHMAFTYDDIDDLLFTYKRLKPLGIEPYWCINHGPTMSMYYHDPDGNSVELQIDNYTDTREIAATFQNEEFDANPIGEDFDPNELIKRHAAGETIEQLRVFQTRTARGAADLPGAHLGRLHAALSKFASLLGK